MKKSYLLRIIMLVLMAASPLSAKNSIDVIIPKPQKIIEGSGSFLLTDKTVIRSNTSLCSDAVHYLQQHLKKSAGYRLKSGSKRGSETIEFRYNPAKAGRSEAYTLYIRPHTILIEARESAGFFYGVITLMQLMDPAIWGKRVSMRSWPIPACTIKDYPRFSWRGMMLDSSRNFFPKSYVKKFIDRMAQHKLNRFHWHLTDDEGWRIEIRHYPLLTKIGARRGPGTKLPFSTYPAMRGAKERVQSGHYSQKDIREIVAYAKARSVEIIPEIDIPGHSKAAIVSYPGLLSDPLDKSEYSSVQRIRNNTINPGVESSYSFLENVISETSRLFPFGYIHLGGDEVPKGAWQKSPAVKKLMRKKGLRNRREVENYFFGRMDRIAAKYGKKLAVWQEAIEGKPRLRKSTMIMAWKSSKAGIVAARKGYPVIMTPVEFLYFDQQYVRSKKEPGHSWSTPVSLKKAYTFKPLSGAGSSASGIRGVQACLWSETLLSESIADYLAWPRALALSELAWTEKRRRNWSNFRERVAGKGLERLKAEGIHYRPPGAIR